MGQSKNNLATEGLSGQVGNLVFRRRKSDGKVFVARQPAAFEGEPSVAQKAIQSKFQQAVIYGRTATTDPAVKAAYAEKASGGKTAFNVAVADYFNAPDIQEVDVTSYNGRITSIIRIRATDDFAVKSIHVSILNGDDTLVEEGYAVLHANGVDWIYTASALNESLTGDKIIVTASDIPLNTKTVEKKL